MIQAKCSEMARYWAMAAEDGSGRWRIYDRDHANRLCGLVNARFEVVWRAEGYRRWPEAEEWKQAVRATL